MDLRLNKVCKVNVEIIYSAVRKLCKLEEEPTIEYVEYEYFLGDVLNCALQNFVFEAET